MDIILNEFPWRNRPEGSFNKKDPFYDSCILHHSALSPKKTLSCCLSHHCGNIIS